MYLLALVFVTNPLTVYCLTNLFTLPVLLLSSLVIWSLPLGMTLAPVVVREREQDTWYTLRTTPFDTETLLLSKGARGADAAAGAAAGGAWSDVFGGGGRERHQPESGRASLSGLSRHPARAPGVRNRDRRDGAGGAALSAGSGAAVRLDDRGGAGRQRVQHVDAYGTAGASVAALLAWMADVGIAELLIVLDPGSMSLTAQGRLLIMFGPVAGYAGELGPVRAALYLVLTFLLRELAVRLLWRWTVYAARV